MAFDSLLEEARGRNPSATDEALIVSVAADLVELLDLNPPIEPEIVASYQGIGRVERSPLAWAGCLVSDGDDLIIRVRQTDSPGRQRFTICHEVAHTFFPGYRHSPQFRCTPLAAPTRRDPIEMLCDVAASELLLPARYVKSVIATSSFDLDTVESVAEECDASLEAAARRLVSLWPEPSLLLRMERITKPREPRGEPKLRVSSTVTNGDWPFMPAYKSVRDDHVLNECLRGSPVDCIADLDDLASTRVGLVELHARPYPFTDSEGVHHDRVLALARRVP